MMKLLPEPGEFEWDQGNRGKNFIAHQVTDGECEEVFFDPRKQLTHDVLHSGTEARFLLLGETKRGRALFIVFTIRSEKIRVISARDLNRKERKLYEKTTQGSQIQK